MAGSSGTRGDSRAPVAPDDLARLVGRRLRNLRQGRGLSLGALASAAGIGKGSLSEVENGIRNPTLSTLYALAGALGVPLAALLAGPAPQPGTTVDSPGVSARLLDVSREGGCVVEVYRLRIDAGTIHRSGPHGPGVTEHILITSGQAVVGRTGSESPVAAGESAQWVSDVPHGYAALGDEPVESVLVIRSPAG